MTHLCREELPYKEPLTGKQEPGRGGGMIHMNDCVQYSAIGNKFSESTGCGWERGSKLFYLESKDVVFFFFLQYS